MELDRTEIVIRQRTPLELLDLTLLVLKRHFVRIAMAGAILGGPMLLLNVWLLHWMVAEDAQFVAEELRTPDAAVWWRYVAHLTTLVYLQFPLVSMPITLLLGAQVFYQAMGTRQMLRQLGQLWLPMLLILGLLRLGLVPVGLELLVDRSLSFDPRTEIWILAVCLPAASLARMFWPFAPEIIGLERCPLRAGDSNPISFSRRRRSLHGPLMGELFNYFWLVAFYSMLLLLMLLGTALCVQSVLTGWWSWNLWFYYGVLPISLWLVGLFVAVFRYLAYIDSRIRLEGWEIELRLRAEAIRLREKNQPWLTAGPELAQERLP